MLGCCVALSLPPEEPSAGPWQVESLQTFVQRLTDDAPDAVGRPVIIAIDGRSASGKTTLATVLSKAVPGSALVHTDDIAWHHSFFDWTELLLEGILEPARTGDNVEYRPPAWKERGREGAIYVPSGCPMLILEGVGAARRELMHVVDRAIGCRRTSSELGQEASPATGVTQAPLLSGMNGWRKSCLF